MTTAHPAPHAKTPSKPQSPASMPWASPHMLGMDGVPADQVRSVLQRSCSIASDLQTNPSSLRGLLKDRAIGLLFFEDSTRTRSSFALAAQRGGAHIAHLSGKSSSINKGETVVDTAKVVESMGVDVIVTRTYEAGGAQAVANAVECCVINAGDGSHEHPTQALNDCYALAEALDRFVNFDFSDLNIAIVGDIASSRVARSATWALTALGAKVSLIGPTELAPESLTTFADSVEVSHNLDDVIQEADAVMMLRIQFERHKGGTQGSNRSTPTIPSLSSYRDRFGLTAERADRMKPGAVVMHPGPMNRGIEVDDAVADGPRSIILRQVAAGIPVRLASLACCIEARDQNK